jgi:hypothetical protein
VVAARFQADDTKDECERVERLGNGDGTKDAGFGPIIWKPPTGEGEPGRPEQGEQKANHVFAKAMVVSAARTREGRGSRGHRWR